MKIQPVVQYGKPYWTYEKRWRRCLLRRFSLRLPLPAVQSTGGIERRFSLRLEAARRAEHDWL